MSAFSWKRAKINEYFNSLKLQLFLNTKSLEMARSCCICSTFDGNKVLELQKNPPVRYHCIPRNKKVRRIWVKFLKKTVPGFRLSKDPRVCNLHFTESDYKSFEPIPQLNRGALPSLHLKPVTEPVARRTDEAASRVSVSKCYRKSLTKRTKKRKEETVRSSNHDENTNKSTNRLSRSVSRNFRGPVAHEKRKAAKHPKTCCICKLYDRQIVRETREKLNRRISFHKFPFGKRNRALMMKWTMAISKVIPGFEANVSLRVCGLHFSESDYKVLAEHSNQYLKEGSVPSLYMRLRDFTSDSVEVNRDSSRSRCDDNTNESSASLSRSEYNDESTTESSFRSETSAEFTTSESRYNESSVDESSFGDDTSGEYSSFSESNNSEISLRGSELSEPSTSSSSKISRESRSECLDTSFESTSNDRRDGENSFCNRSSSESKRKDGSDDGNLFCSESSSESGGDENLFGSQSSSESKSNEEANGNSFGSEIALHSMSNDEVVDDNLSPRQISSESKSKSHDIDVDENSELTIPMEIDPNDENIDSPVIPSCDSDQPLLDDNVGETCASSPTSQQLRGPDAEGSKSNGSEPVDSSENRNDKLEGVNGVVISNGLDQNQDNAMDLSNEKNDNESSTSMETLTIQKPRVVFSNKDDEITNRVSEPSMTTFPAPEPASEDITESVASGQSDAESRVFAEQSQSPRKEIPTVVKREADRVPTPRKSKSPFQSIRFECSYCTESYDDAERLREHKRWHADSRHYKCGFCDKILSSCQSWEYHVNVHAGYKPYTCDHCEKEFVTKQALKTHTRCNKHKCQFCGQSFHSKSKLKEHRKTHTEEEIHRCNICDKYFPKLSALNIHKSKHKTKTTYECQYCGNVYESKAELQYHIKLTGENLLICPTCLDTFEDYLDFKIHLLDHTEKESFVCTVCDKTFVSTDILEDHILSIHNDRSGGAFS